MKIFLAFLMIFSSLFASAQNDSNEFHGLVTDKESEEPLGYASVYWKSNYQGVLTNEQGYFSIASSETSKDSLVIQYVGFQTFVIPQSNLKQINKFQLLRENTIESITVVNLTADEIIAKARENYAKNHYRKNTKQQGFIETLFYDTNELFQVSQTSYDVVYTTTKKGNRTQKVHKKKIRSVIDSAQYKSINNELNFKKINSTIGTKPFITLGQEHTFSTKEKDTKNVTSTYQLVDEIEYQGEYAYLIEFERLYKGKKLFTGKMFIEKEHFAFLFTELESTPNTNLNVLVKGIGKKLIQILGFDFNFKSIKNVVYFKRNQQDKNTFDLEKGLSSIEIDVKRTERWIHGKIVQEFYLQPREKLITKPKMNFDEPEIVYDFSDNTFFGNHFYKQPSASTLQKINQIQEKNKGYKGGIYSDRYEQWKEKIDKKAAKRKARKQKK